MVEEPRVVSIFTEPDRQGRQWSGLLLDARHILTVKHALPDCAQNTEVQVRLIEGREGDTPAHVESCHAKYDAAIVKLSVPVDSPPKPALDRHFSGSYKGKMVSLWVIDPDTHNRSTVPNFSIGDYDSSTDEHVLSPEDAHGHSGGVVELDGLIVGLLSRRKQDDPLCRAVAMDKLIAWIDEVIGESAGVASTGSGIAPAVAVSDGYRELVRRVRERVRQRLTEPHVDALVAKFGADPLDGFDFAAAHAEVGRLLTRLREATEAARGQWTRLEDRARETLREHLRTLLADLVKLAIDPALSPREAREVAESKADRLHLACRFRGTADVVYAALWDLPHWLDAHPKEADIVGNHSVHADELLPSGVGRDLEQEILRKLWARIENKAERDIPDRIDGNELRLLMSRLKRARSEGRGYLFVATGPAEWCERGKHCDIADRLHLGLVIHDDGECHHLLLDEVDLIDRIREYLTILETL